MPVGIYKRTKKHRENLKKCNNSGWFQKGHKINNGKKPNKKQLEALKIGWGLRKGKHHTEESKRKISEANKGHIAWNKGKKMPQISGKNHPNWNNGSSFEPYSVDWTETLKRSIRERDNYICQLCSQYGKCVHHKDYDKKNCNPINLITLCYSCNVKVNYNRDYWTKYFSQFMEL